MNPTKSEEKEETALRNVFCDVALGGLNRGDLTVLEAKFVDLEF